MNIGVLSVLIIGVYILIDKLMIEREKLIIIGIIALIIILITPNLLTTPIYYYLIPLGILLTILYVKREEFYFEFKKEYVPFILLILIAILGVLRGIYLVTLIAIVSIIAYYYYLVREWML